MVARPRARRHHLLLVVALVGAALLPSAGAQARVLQQRLPVGSAITLTRVVGGLDAPVDVRSAFDGSGRLFVVERRGTIRVVKSGALVAGSFLDIRGPVLSGGERGLLGLAFHPRFSANGRFFVTYTRDGGDIVIARFTANAARTSAPASSERRLLVIEHSAASNHNGGGMAFGPDGDLYVGIGDGGGSGDPEHDAQDISRNLLGKVLRLDVDGTGAGPYDRYAIPTSNPFAGSKPGLGEIWAYGLRNPWRLSFDRRTGALWIADVGQNKREEVNRQPADTAGGQNYGWNVMEGGSCFRPSRCPLAGDTLPVIQYQHVDGDCSITGGYVYRGTRQPRMAGQYIYADFCSGRIWSMDAVASDKAIQRADTTRQITSFGETQGGELLAVTIDGGLYELKAP
jgi:glucose/arabinose dehydrogenase